MTLVTNMTFTFDDEGNVKEESRETVEVEIKVTKDGQIICSN